MTKTESSSRPFVLDAATGPASPVAVAVAATLQKTFKHKTLEKRPRKKHSKSRPWLESFGLLQAYKKEHGHCNTPYYYEPDRALGNWVAKQRKHRDKPKLLSIEQRGLLEGLGFEWCSTQERIWNEKFARLEQFFQINGHCMVPNGSSHLSNFVAKQRQVYGQGRLTHDRYERLQSINFVWRVKQFSTNKNRDHTREDLKWTEKYERLVAFEKEFGTCAVPFQYELDKSLGRWVNEQRTQNTRSLLRADRKELLDQVNFLWRINTGVKPAVRVLPNPSLLKDAPQQPPQQQQRHPIAMTMVKPKKVFMQPPKAPAVKEEVADMEEDEEDWFVSVPMTNIEISADTVSATAAASVAVNYKKESFESMLSRLEKFQHDHGHVSISPTDSTMGLGPWMAVMKQKAREGVLSYDHETKLRTLGVILQGGHQIWNDQYQKMQSYMHRHGHSFVSTRDDPELAAWTVSQRFLHSHQRLLPDRKVRLDAIHFQFDPPTSTTILFSGIVPFVSEDEASAPMMIEGDNDGLGDDNNQELPEGGLFAAASMWNA